MHEASSWRQSFIVWLTMALMGLSASGCSRARELGRASAPSMALVAPQTASPSARVPDADRAMRITVETTIVVAHRDPAVAGLRATVSAFGGYVSEGTVSGPDVGGSALFTVKVPAGTVTDFRGKLAGFGEVTRDSEKAEDVTESRADIKARLRNARAEDQRLLDMLANRTGSLGDVVLVEKELASVRETIERFEAEERTLEGQISFATVKVELTTVYVAVNEGAGQKLATAARDGLVTAKDVMFGLVTLTLSGGPTLLVLGGLAYLGYLVLRAWARRRRAVRPPT